MQRFQVVNSRTNLISSLGLSKLRDSFYTTQKYYITYYRHSDLPDQDKKNAGKVKFAYLMTS